MLNNNIMVVTVLSLPLSVMIIRVIKCCVRIACFVMFVKGFHFRLYLRKVCIFKVTQKIRLNLMISLKCHVTALYTRRSTKFCPD